MVEEFRQNKNEGLMWNMGRSCLRFTKVEKIPLEEIGKMIAKSPMDAFVKASKK